MARAPLPSQPPTCTTQHPPPGPAAHLHAHIRPTFPLHRPTLAACPCLPPVLGSIMLTYPCPVPPCLHWPQDTAAPTGPAAMPKKHGKGTAAVAASHLHHPTPVACPCRSPTRSHNAHLQPAQANARRLPLPPTCPWFHCADTPMPLAALPALPSGHRRAPATLPECHAALAHELQLVTAGALNLRPHCPTACPSMHSHEGMSGAKQRTGELVRAA